jgi:phosphate transport system permease protein
MTGTDVLEAPPRLSSEERRVLVHESAARTFRRRVVGYRIYMGALCVALLGAFIPLGGILWTVIGRGLPYMSLKFFTSSETFPSVFHRNAIGGISAAIQGTVECVGLAAAMALPIGVLVAMALYEGRGRILRALRIALEVFVGMPSLLFGVFITLTVVRLMHQQLTIFAGSLALAFLMVPLIAVSCEDALRAVPDHLTEAGLALGARRSKIMGRVVLPVARPRILTGMLLSLSRAVGETAPVLFVIGTALSPDWNPHSEGTTLTTAMYNLQGDTYPSQHNEVWGIALVLIAGVLVINITSRVIVARANRGSG